MSLPHLMRFRFFKSHSISGNRFLIFAALLSFALLNPSHADEWPGWHGLAKQGASSSDNPPLSWSTNQNVMWKTAIPGRGHSSPVVTEDSVFVTAAYAAGRGRVIKASDRFASYALGLALAVGFLWVAYRDL